MLRLIHFQLELFSGALFDLCDPWRLQSQLHRDLQLSYFYQGSLLKNRN